MPAIPEPTRDTPLWISLRKILNRLEEMPKAMRSDANVGIDWILISQTQMAFAEGGLGGEPWPVRYPKMQAPFINKAGALNRLNRGLGVVPSLFNRTPVLRGTTGFLLDAVSPGSTRFSRMAKTNTVEVGWGSGPPRQYAGLHQMGGESRQRITEAARRKLTQETNKAKGQKKKALGRMGFIYKQDVLVTKVHRRPMLGIIPETKEEIREFLVDYVEGRVPVPGVEDK